MLSRLRPLGHRGSAPAEAPPIGSPLPAFEQEAAMKTIFHPRGPRMAAILLVASLVSACDGGSGGDPITPPDAWTWVDLGGPDAFVSPYVPNHETLVVVEDAVLLGTGDGVWQRPLTGSGQWERAGLAGKLIHALALTRDGGRILAAGFDPEDEAAPTAWYSTDAGSSWIAAAAWPQGEPGGPEAGFSFPFYALEPDPVEADVVYGNLGGDTLAVTVDGGATWLMANGATSPGFGYPCVPFRTAAAAVLMQGCEAPLDFAWVAAWRVVKDSPFDLPDFRYLYAFPEDEELGNRRINAIAAPADRDDRVLVGVEGGLVQLTSSSGEWNGRDDVEAEWLFRSEDGDDWPYAYIRAIAVLDDEGRHILFGGPLNGDNEKPLLFETTNGGETVWQHNPDIELDDPRIEQSWRLGPNEVLLVIGEADEEAGDDQGSHRPRIFHLVRGE